MTRTANTNYTASGTAFVKATADADAFDAGDVQLLQEAVDGHHHGDTRGLGVRRIQTGTAPAASGEVRVVTATPTIQYHDGTSVRTLTDIASTQTLTNKTLTAPILTTPEVTTGGLRVTAGNVGVGLAPVAHIGVYVNGATLATATAQYGMVSDATYSSAATVSGSGAYIRVQTAAAAFTMTSAYGAYIDTPVKGAGSTITTGYGVYVQAQTEGTTNYGLYVKAVTGAAGGAGVYTEGTGASPYPLVINNTSAAGANGLINFSRAGAGKQQIVFDVNDALIINNSGGNPALAVSVSGTVAIGLNAALATNATTGFLQIPTCAGNPSGTPETVLTAKASLVLDTTTTPKRLYVYNPVGAAWGYVALT